MSFAGLAEGLADRWVEESDMAASVDELTVQWEENGELKVRELDKQVLSAGSWATVMFLFQEKDPRTGGFRAPKIALRRYQKARGGWRFHSKFHVSSKAQAKEVARIIETWLPHMDGDETDDE